MTDIFLVGVETWCEDTEKLDAIRPEIAFLNREDAERYVNEYNAPILEARALLSEWHDAIRSELIRMGRDDLQMGFASWMHHIHNTDARDAVADAESRVWQRDRPSQEICEEMAVKAVPLHD